MKIIVEECHQELMEAMLDNGLVIKKISERNPIQATSIPIKKLSELGAAKDNNNDESPIKFMG